MVNLIHTYMEGVHRPLDRPFNCPIYENLYGTCILPDPYILSLDLL